MTDDWDGLHDVCKKGWVGGGSETACGGGSLRSYSSNVIKKLPEFFVKHNVKTVADCGCGDWNWMKEVDLSGIESYHGYDWVIRDGALEHRSDKVSFTEFNIGTEVIGKVDLIICRDVLIHLTNDMVLKTLENFRESGSKYLLATTDIRVTNELRHVGIKFPSFSPINLQATPFDMGKLEDMIEDTTDVRFMGLWKL